MHIDKGVALLRLRFACVTARARVNAVNAAPSGTGYTGDMADMMLQNQLRTESDVHIYQTPRRHHQLQQQQQATVASRHDTIFIEMVGLYLRALKS